MKIPKYIQELVELRRIEQAPISEQSSDGGVYGYVFRLYRMSNAQYLYTLGAEAERLVKWARREYADANVLQHYDSEIGRDTLFFTFSEKEHRKPYYKRDYVLVSITDPVAQQLERLIIDLSKRREIK